MIEVERRQGFETGKRAEVWSWWRRLEVTKPWVARICGAVLAALVFASAGVLAGWVISKQWSWVKWDGVTVTHSVKMDGNSELVIDLAWDVSGKCDRLRLMSPWSLVAYYPDRNASVALPVTPMDELIARAGHGHGRVIISLGSRLESGIRHEISLSLVCLQDANGGTIHDADPAVVVKEFIP